MNAFEPSQDLIEAVKEFEGGRLVPYRDPIGIWTVGYGHRFYPGSAIPQAITAAQAEDWLKSDLASAGRMVNIFVKVALAQHQWDALVDFVYNLGAARLQHATLLTRVNEQDWPQAQVECRKWVYAGGNVLPGLQKRREWEAVRLDPNFGVQNGTNVG